MSLRISGSNPDIGESFSSVHGGKQIGECRRRFASCRDSSAAGCRFGGFVRWIDRSVKPQGGQC